MNIFEVVLFTGVKYECCDGYYVNIMRKRRCKVIYLLLLTMCISDGQTFNWSLSSEINYSEKFKYEKKFKL